MQDDTLISGSIGDNMLFFREISQAGVVFAAQAAGIHEAIMGYL